MSYLALAKQIETRQEAYRRALNRYWQGCPRETEEAYQVLIGLLDELGVAQACRIHQDELRRWQEVIQGWRGGPSSSSSPGPCQD